MKKGSLFIAAFLLISGVLRIAGPGAAAPAPEGNEPAQKTNKANAGKNTPQAPYLEKFEGKIKEFYGVREGDSGQNTSLASYLKVLQTSSDPLKREPVQFVIAILPDPVHTHLGLLFDRGVEALQQAAQMSDYVFDQAIMPWDRTPHAKSSDLKTSREEIEEQAQRESYPGLLIFRRDLSLLKSTSPKGPLFVLVVGETPTAGLNKEQFRNAVKIALEIRGTSSATENGKKPPLRILGPSFSGSLESLKQELQQPEVQQLSSQEFVFSGMVTATGSMSWFQQQLRPASHFASFSGKRRVRA